MASSTDSSSPGVSLQRRQLLRWLAMAPALPALFPQGAWGAEPGRQFDGRVLVVVRMLGGLDGLNAVVPFRDDRYRRLRPNIALGARDRIAMDGGDRALNRHLAAYLELMQQGHAGILQGVGYPRPSRSHLRATEIWETGSIAERAPQTGWLGRYFEAGCGCDAVAVAGMQFGDTAGRLLDSAPARARLVASPELLLNTPLETSAAAGAAAGPMLRRVLATQESLHDAAAVLRVARRSSGRRYAYPATAFGNALRWTADLIEAHAAPRVYYLTLGSFETPTSASFDSHVDELEKHAVLFPQFGEGLQAFTRQLRRSGDFGRVLVTTFSDFGRQVAENRTRGTEHGDAGLLFYAGGAIRGGLQGVPADLGKVTDGGLDFSMDFRRVHAEVLQHWFGVPPEQLPGESFPRAGILAA